MMIKPELTLMQYPQRGEDVTIPLLEKERHSVATNQGHAVPALGDRDVALLGEDVLQVRLGEEARGRGANRSTARVQGARCCGSCVLRRRKLLWCFTGYAPV